MQTEKLDIPTKPAPGLGMVNVGRQFNGTVEFSGGNVGGRPQYAGAQVAGFQAGGAGGNFGMNRPETMPPTPKPAAAPAIAMPLGFNPGSAGAVANAQGVAPRNTASPVSQIPNSAPEDWRGGSGDRITGTELTRNVSNTLSALAPVGGPAAGLVARGGAKLLGAGSSPLALSTLGYAVPIAAGSALVNAPRESEATRTPLSSAAASRPDQGASTGAAPGLGFGTGRDFSRELASVPKDLPSDMRDGVVLKTKDANGRTVYSGRNVGADAQMVDGMGRSTSGRGTVSTVPGMAPDEARAILDRPFDPRNAMNPAQRAQYDAEVASAQATNRATAAQGGGRGVTIGDLLRSGQQRRAAAIERQQSDIRTNEAQVGLGMRRQADTEANSAVNREQTQLGMQSARQFQALQSEYLEADTDAKRASIAKKIQALNGKSETPNRFTVVPGGSAIDPVSGMAVQRPGMVLDNSTGKLVDLGAQGQAPAGQANPYPEGTRLTHVGDGKTYVVRDGRPVPE